MLMLPFIILINHIGIHMQLLNFFSLIIYYRSYFSVWILCIILGMNVMKILIHMLWYYSQYQAGCQIFLTNLYQKIKNKTSADGGKFSVGCKKTSDTLQTTSLR